MKFSLPERFEKERGFNVTHEFWNTQKLQAD